MKTIYVPVYLLSAVISFTACGQQDTVIDRSAEPASTEVIYPVQLSEKEWRSKLDPQQFNVLREAGTERAFTGEYWNDYTSGVYQCAGCDQPLFNSDTKFKSGTGWPSYYQPIADSLVVEHADESFGWVRTEVVCSSCGGHLGHVFDDGPKPTGLRYCINSAALRKVEK